MDNEEKLVDASALEEAPRPSPVTRSSSSSSSRAPQRALPSVPPTTPPTVPPVPKTTGRSHLFPATNALPSSVGAANGTELTPLRAHYLKKTLINLEVSRELAALSDPALGASALGLLGPPFAPLTVEGRPKTSTINHVTDAELPLLRYMFHQFLLPFPFLATAPPTFWAAKVQPFLTSFLTISSRPPVAVTADDSIAGGQASDFDAATATEEDVAEHRERQKLWDKIEKNLGVLMSLGIKLHGGEEVVRISQNELRKLEDEARERHHRWKEREMRAGGGFEVNIVCVRLVTEKGRVRSKSHDEFIIRTRRNGAPDIFVSRRYGDFKRLAEELRSRHPDDPLPPPPPKDKSAMTVPVQQQQSYYSAYNPLRAIYGANPSGTTTPPSASSSETPSLERTETEASIDQQSSSPLSREKNRLTLRAYLTALLAIPSVLNSPVLRSFLLSGPTTLSPAEQADAARRAQADAVREEGRKRFREEAERRVEGLREGLGMFKGDVLGKRGGLNKVFEVVRKVERVEDLPRAEASVLEWGRISLAATVFQLFVAADTASETFAAMKRLHGLMPYFVLKGILKVSNPMAMIRGVLDLFLARPFGGQSLIQRMFSSSLVEELRYLEEDIQVMRDRIDDPVLCQKVEQYVDAPYEIQAMFKGDALEEKLELLAVILRSQEMPQLNRQQIQRVIRANRAFKVYRQYQLQLDDSDDDEGPDNEDAWLFEDLSVLLKMLIKKREKEGFLALIFEGTTAELLKDIITIFYSPLAQVYKAASIADSIGDLQNFINDLIRTVEAVEELSSEDPSRTVQTFIDLVQRHEQSFYTFVHKVHSKGEGLFDSLMRWLELFLNFAREGLPDEVDLEFILPHAGAERQAILRECDEVAAYYYKLKIAHEEKIRRRFQKDGASEEEAAFLNSVVASLNMNDSMMNEAGEAVAGDETDDEEDEEDDEDEASIVFDPAKDPGTATWKSGAKDSETASVSSDLIAGPSGSGSRQEQDHPLSAPAQSGSFDKPRSSMNRIRNSLDFSRKVDPSAEAARKALPPPLPQPMPVKRSRRKGKRGTQEVAEMPTLKHLPGLVPIFVEMVKPQLTVQPIQPPAAGPPPAPAPRRFF